ncbi:MAG: MerR family transcriptional regulator [Paracoccaceae bacterium]
MDKSPDAFRTISEVADWLGTPTHVLRFWESRFTQVKPVKRAGGRRYYRPGDMELLGGIKKLLHDDGMTIRGVQKLLRDEGVRHVAAQSQPLDAAIAAEYDGSEVVDATALPDGKAEAKPAPMITNAPQDDPDNVVPLSRTLAETEHREGKQTPEPAKADAPPEPKKAEPKQAEATPARPEPSAAPGPDEAQPDLLRDAAPQAKPEPEPEPVAAEPETPGIPKPRPTKVDVPPDPQDDDMSLPSIIDVAALLRKTASRSDRPSPAKFKPLYDRLSELRDRMAANKRN